MMPSLVLVADRLALRLSDTVIVKVVVEGQAPLRVEVPKELLAGVSAESWSTVEVGAAQTENLPGGLERWTQSYRCSPYTPGVGIPLEFAPFPVKAGPAVEAVSLSARPLSLDVKTDLMGARAEDARPVTSVEELPPAPPTTPIALPAVWAIGSASLLLTLAAIFATIRRRNRPPVVPPLDEALTELAALPDPPSLQRVAGILRHFLYRRFGFPTETATTPELLRHIREGAGWVPERLAELEAILAECDIEKFGNTPGNDAAATEYRERARAWVAATDTGN